MASVLPLLAFVRSGLPFFVGPLMDLKLGESHRYSSEVTQFPIEGGATVSDHIILNPIELTTESFITNYDFAALSQFGISPPPFPPLGLKAASALNLFRFLIHQQRETFTILAHHTLYTDMALIDVDITTEAPITGALRFTSTWRQVNKVQLETTAIAESQVQSTGDNNVGKTATTSVSKGVSPTQAVSGDSTSTLLQVFGGG